jgi:diguanylate cyclase (GGDEF)-like protein/putative nucleotidyltransferase with HDIG domain
MKAGINIHKPSKNATLHNLKLAGEILRAAKSSQEVLDFAVKIFLQLGFDRVRVWLINEKENKTCGGKCSYIDDKKFSSFCFPLTMKRSSAYFAKALGTKKPFINRVNNLLKTLPGGGPDITVEFPMLAGRKLVGTIGVDNIESEKPLHTQELEAYMPFVNHIAVSLEHALLQEKLAQTNIELQRKVEAATIELQEKNKELEWVAYHDALSGLPNRRYLDQKLAREFGKATEKQPLTFAMLDIDFLKQLNDTHGHEAGDILIQKIGKVLHEDRGVDFAARYAGDEFVVLLISRPRPERRKILQRLIKKIKIASKQTVSIGSVTYPDSGITSIIDLMRTADDALYHAKHTGRGRLVCAQSKEERVVPFTERRAALQKIEARGTVAVDYIQQLDAFNKTSDILRKASNEKTALQKIANILNKELGFEKIYILVKDAASEKLMLSATSGVKAKQVEKLKKNPLSSKDRNSTNQALDRRMVLDLTSKNISERFRQAWKTEQALVIPLVGRQHAIGVIVAGYTAEKSFGKNDYTFLLSLGNQIENGITKARASDQIKDFNRRLKKEIQIATQKVWQYSHSLEKQICANEKLREAEIQIHFEIISALATSLEAKDLYTQGHSVRVARYASRLGEAVGLRENQLTNLRYAGLLHDIGKVAIDQTVLNKTTSLTEEEAQKLSLHPIFGAKIVNSVRFLQPAARIILQHHERWDGKGYPNRIAGKQITLEGRILTIADAYDAMVSRRSYGEKMTPEAAIAEINAGSGKQFDPELVKIFTQLAKEKRLRTPKSEI